MQTMIIHMAKDQKRAPNVRKLLNTLPNAQIMEAVIGKDALAQGLIETAPGTRHKPNYPFPLSAAEIGCFLSHRACWQQIIALNLPYALIVEDDMATEPPWQNALELAQRHISPEMFIRLPAKHREKPARILAQEADTQLFLPKQIGLQTVCQIVGQNAARRLLAASTVIDRPVDTFLQMHWITGQPIHTILPNGVSEETAALGGSTIQKKKTGNKLARELKRLSYRLKITARPQNP